MKIREIVKEVNRYLSNSTSYKLSYNELKPYIDNSIDYINEELLTDYPTPNEMYDMEKLYFYLVSQNKVIALPNRKNKLRFNTIELKLYDGDVEVDGLFDAVYLNETNRAFLLDNDGNWYEIYDENVPDDNILDYNFNIFPEQYVRGCVIFGTVANRLEEEDELEEQYSVYKSKVNKALTSWKRKYYSCYDCGW